MQFRWLLAGLIRLFGSIGLLGSLGLVGLMAAAADPWKGADVVEALDLAATLAHGSKLPIVYVGPRSLFRTGRISGATFHGPTSDADGLAGLKQWARSLPRSEELVIYCGCCPIEKCPNIRPAFRALREMGFTKLRVLVLASSFEKDWVTQGYPVER